MNNLPVAPLQVSVSSSTHVAEKLYPLVDAAIADVSTSVCELLNGHVVVSSLTERDLESAIVRMRTNVSDLYCGPISVRYLTINCPRGEEPYYRVVITSPMDYVGDVIGDLSKRAGHIEAMHRIDAGCAIKCAVPVATMLGYDLALSKMTRGQGKTDYAFIGYHWRRREPEPPLPPAIAARA
jgi:predicted membrane GTPase involved in stress response